MKERLPPKYFVWCVAGIWVVVAVLIHLRVFPAEVVERYALGGEDGFLPVQLLTYSFLIHPNMSPAWSFIIIAFNTAWLMGLAEMASEWMDALEFTRLYSAATVGVGLLCWSVARNYDPETVTFGTLATVSTMIGAVTAYAPGSRGYIWGENARKWLTEPRKRIATWIWIIIGGIFIARSISGITDMGPRGVFLATLYWSWMLWPVVALVRMPMGSICLCWCFWRTLQLINSWIWLERVSMVTLVDIFIPLLSGIAYGLVVKHLHSK